MGNYTPKLANNELGSILNNALVIIFLRLDPYPCHCIKQLIYSNELTCIKENKLSLAPSTNSINDVIAIESENVLNDSDKYFYASLDVEQLRDSDACGEKYTIVLG